ncbi:ABC transporter substrate-binding protein [Lentilactobacillus curieae]|uniref:Endolytic murein transglycosylase n=1 Tax=Lentilactobacillus curieae TaxID=1138822 RepID=A0A1S6QK65_9LACO|nr:endolytic transglycosylase MltG [Lentilactobacillus curieae]AQW21973.1 ABC transporter substrate-binding protein [Lentilactobacillus curieae]
MNNGPTTPAPKQNKGLGKKIIITVVTLLVILLAAIGLLGYNYFQESLKPLDPKNEQVSQVHIPLGASNKQIGSILQNKKIVKSGMVFDYYVKSNNMTNFRAGYYQLKPSMSLKRIAKELQKGGSDEPIQSAKGKLLVMEGANIKDISYRISSTTDFSSKSFLSLMKDKTFINSLYKKYPQLLQSAMKAKDVRYRLEGYLFPATYEVKKNMSLEALVTQMVAKTNQVMTPYYSQIKKRHMTVQEFMTLASLAEKEGVNQTDRRKIVGVFMNRIKINMPIQSDISVLYSLGVRNKDLTTKDLQNDSPYNLYKNYGYGPGPFDSPSLSSIQAVLHPLYRSKGYLYFVADTKTGKVYYSKTYAEHQEKSAKYLH